QRGVKGDDQWCRGGGDIADQVGLGGGDAVRAAGQRGGGDRPDAISGHHDAADAGAAIKQGDSVTGDGGAGEGGHGDVGDVVRVGRAAVAGGSQVGLARHQPGQPHGDVVLAKAGELQRQLVGAEAGDLCVGDLDTAAVESLEV